MFCNNFAWSVIYKNIELLCCTPKANTISQLYFNLKKSCYYFGSSNKETELSYTSGVLVGLIEDINPINVLWPALEELQKQSLGTDALFPGATERQRPSESKRASCFSLTVPQLSTKDSPH